MHRAALGISTRTVGGTEQLNGSLPRWHVPQVGKDGEWGVIFQYAISLTFVGLIESVMTLQACDEITETLPSVFRSNQECVAQGVANLVSGLFGAERRRPKSVAQRRSSVWTDFLRRWSTSRSSDAVRSKDERAVRLKRPRRPWAATR